MTVTVDRRLSLPLWGCGQSDMSRIEAEEFSGASHPHACGFYPSPLGVFIVCGPQKGGACRSTDLDCPSQAKCEKA